MKIDTVMTLAAGLGTRMRPLTLTVPKPLIEVAGKPLIEWGLEAAARAGIGRAVVNIHWLGDAIETWAQGWKAQSVILSDERETLLDSGGGVKKALPLIGPGPFLVLNADTFWIDAPESQAIAGLTLGPLQPGEIRMLVARPDDAVGHGKGPDFALGKDGTLVRWRDAGPDDGGPVIYAGALILTPAHFERIEDAVFSLNRLFDTAISAGRLKGRCLEGLWLTVGTPDAIGEAEAAIERYRAESQPA